MHRVLLVLSLALLAAGCNQSTPAAVNTTDTSQTQQNSFSKKERCATYLSEIQQRLADEKEAYAILEKLFYSHSRNSCMHIESRVAEGSNNKRTATSLILKDTLTNEMIKFVLYFNDDEEAREKKREEFYNVVREWEE